jgi:serine phosphatase RsbU (regulator of sigma subunit)
MTPLTIDVAVAKTNKHASRDSGDTVELIERPAGGFSVVLVDGQGSGRAAKSLSMQVSSKAVALLKEGVRDGAVARGAHDYLFAYRHGQVSATLDILSVDLHSRSVVVARNAETPMLLDTGGGFEAVPVAAGPIGLYRATKPQITEQPLRHGLRVVLVSDGITAAGRRARLTPFDCLAFARTLPADLTAEELADRLLQEAVRLDEGRLQDDATVVALVIWPHDERILVRRMSATVPLP